MNPLARLKEKVQEDYQSTFEFEKYDIDEDIKKQVIENEVIIIRNFRTMSESMYNVCKALHDTSVKLKADRSFQAWYENIGLGKDKVSELLKRYNLYIAFPSNFKYITALSHQAVKILTAESLDSTILYDIVELEIVKVDDLKCFIELRNNNTSQKDIIDIDGNGEYKVNPLIQKETKKCINYNKFEALKKNISKMDLKQVIQTEKEIETLESYIKDLKKSLETRSSCFDNAGALKIEFDDIHPLTSNERWLLSDVKKILDYSWIPGATTLSVKITNHHNSNRTKKDGSNKEIDDVVEEIRNKLVRIEDKDTNESFVKEIDWKILIEKETTVKQRLEVYKKALEAINKLTEVDVV